MEKIKLPRSSYEELTKIIVAYSNQNKPCSLDDIAQASGVGSSVVSANNAFLSLIEIIEGGNKKVITHKGRNLAKALEHEIIDEIKRAWSEIIDENDFLTKMAQAIKIRKGMEFSQLENHIAFSSGEAKGKGVKTGARAVVEMLLQSGKVKEDGDKIIINGEDTGYSSNKDSDDNYLNPPKDISKNQIPSNSQIKTSTNLSGISINIDLTINAKPNELDGLGTKIKELIKEISNEE